MGAVIRQFLSIFGMPDEVKAEIALRIKEAGITYLMFVADVMPGLLDHYKSMPSIP